MVKPSIITPTAAFDSAMLMSKLFFVCFNPAGNLETQKAMRLYRSVVTCSVVGFAHCITHIYAAVGVFGVYSNVTVVKAWPWWSFQTLMRSEEILMCVLVFVIGGKTRKITGTHAITALQTVLRQFVACYRRRPMLGQNRRVTPAHVVDTNEQPTCQGSTKDTIQILHG